MSRNLEVWWRFAVLGTIGAAALFSQANTQGIGRADAKMPMAKIGTNNIVKLEVASSEREIQRGLMYRTSLPEDAGMVFIFHPPKPVNFWMYHTLIPLDMIFIKNGKIIKIFEQVPPCRSEKPENCPTYPPGPGITASEVIEVNGGYAKRHLIKAGDPVTYQMP
jgi:uncharacterized membrane protein (UPF0127 family)